MFAILAPVWSARAQEYVVSRENDNVSVEGPEGEKIVNISSDKDSPGKVRLQLAGVELVMGKGTNGEQPAKKEYRFARPGHIGLFEIGTPFLSAPNYSGYDDRTFLQLNGRKSYMIGLTAASLSVGLTRNDMLSFSFGIQFAFNEYVFANPITLKGDGNRIEPYPLNAPTYKKSKLVTGGIRIPAILELNLPKEMFLAAGVYGGFNSGAYTKTKFPKVKEFDKMDTYLNRFNWGLTFRIGYDIFVFTLNYDMTSMFREGMGPEVYPMSFAVGFKLWDI